MNSVDITIVQVPEYIIFDCPYCGEEVEVDYDDFQCDMMDNNPGNWGYESFLCPKCHEELEVGDVDWD